MADTGGIHVHQTSLSCGCNVDYCGQRCRFHAEAPRQYLGLICFPCGHSDHARCLGSGILDGGCLCATESHAEPVDVMSMLKRAIDAEGGQADG